MPFLRTRRRRTAIAAAAGASVALSAMNISQVEAAPGDWAGNYYFFAPGNDHTNGRLYMYANWVLQADYRAGSGTYSGSLNNPCNKYTGGNDPNGGGRQPGNVSSGGPATIGPVYNDADLYKFMVESDQWASASVYGYDYGCSSGGIFRTELGIHSKNAWNGYSTYGCIKITKSDLDHSLVVYQFKWGASLGSTYWDVVHRYDFPTP